MHKLPVYYMKVAVCSFRIPRFAQTHAADTSGGKGRHFQFGKEVKTGKSVLTTE